MRNVTSLNAPSISRGTSGSTLLLWCVLAALLGNVAGPLSLMTWLAEHHPDRLAGLVFLAHQAPAVAVHREPAVTEFWDMANAEGTRYPAGFDFLGIFLQQAETGEWCDPAARKYFATLAAGTARADALRGRLGELDARAHLSAFERAFGPRMDVERLDIPAVSGYEYQQAPGLIEPLIRGFLEEVSAEERRDGEAPPDTVHVAPPTGDETDRASILAALERALPGETVQFGPGTYLVGEVIRVETPRITLLGHPDGTVLRGCDPEIYEADEREAFAAGGQPSPGLATRCGMFELTGGDVTVRGLTFEYSRRGLLLGCCHTEPRFQLTPGGYTIENNVFRNSLNGIRPWTTEPSVIRGNEFINTFHAISGVGSHLHVLDNEISVPDPSRVPGVGHPSFAIALGPLPGVAADALGLEGNGQGFVIAGNRIEGHTDGIYITVHPGVTFRGNVIRDNTIRVSRVPIPPAGPRPYIVNVTAEADSTIVGIPIALYSRPGFGGSQAEGQEGWFEDNLIVGNRILGAEGVGLALQRGRGNRILGNAFSGVAVREPFPGNTVVSSSELWEEANGSGIWISPDSEDNEVAGNTFVNIAGDTVVVGGAGREARDAVEAAWYPRGPDRPGIVTPASRERGRTPQVPGPLSGGSGA